MNAQTAIAALLRDAKHIADVNSMSLVSYLISMALLHMGHGEEGSDERVA